LRKINDIAQDKFKTALSIRVRGEFGLKGLSKVVAQSSND